MDKVRCMLVKSQLLMTLLVETLLIACYLVNLSPSIALNFKTPYKMWQSKLVNYDNLKMFGYPAYAHINEGKLAPRALKD